MSLLTWIKNLKNLKKPKKNKPVHRTASDNASIESYMEKTSYGYQMQNNQHTSSDNCDGMEP